MTLNQPSTTSGNAEYLRMANNGTWQASLQGGNGWFGGIEVDVGSSNSGSTGGAKMTNSGQFLARSAGYFGLGSATTATSIDTGLARTSAGLFEINTGASGGQAAANMRDLKLRHTIASGAAPSLTTGTGSIAGGDEAGRVTLSAASQTSIVVTFGTTYTNPPACVANDESTATLVQAVASASTLTLNGSFGAADKITWRCGSY